MATTATAFVQEAQSAQMTKYRLIPKGFGGTCTFVRLADAMKQNANASPETASYIATFDCTAPVGISFQLDSNRYFAAHIDAHIEQGRDGVLFDQRMHHHEMKQRLSEVVYEALEAECKHEAWQIDHNPDFGQNLIITCERLRDVETQAMYREQDSHGPHAKDNVLPGAIVAYAVLMWLREKLRVQLPVPEDDLLRSVRAFKASGLSVQQRSGFVVKHTVHGWDVLDRLHVAGQRAQVVHEPDLKEWRWVWHTRAPENGWEGGPVYPVVVEAEVMEVQQGREARSKDVDLEM